MGDPTGLGAGSILQGRFWGHKRLLGSRNIVSTIIVHRISYICIRTPVHHLRDRKEGRNHSTQAIIRFYFYSNYYIVLCAHMYFTMLLIS